MEKIPHGDHTRTRTAVIDLNIGPLYAMDSSDYKTLDVSMGDDDDSGEVRGWFSLVSSIEVLQLLEQTINNNCLS